MGLFDDLLKTGDNSSSSAATKATNTTVWAISWADPFGAMSTAGFGGGNTSTSDDMLESTSWEVVNTRHTQLATSSYDSHSTSSHDGSPLEKLFGGNNNSNQIAPKPASHTAKNTSPTHTLDEATDVVFTSTKVLADERDQSHTQNTRNAPESTSRSSDAWSIFQKSSKRTTSNANTTTPKANALSHSPKSLSSAMVGNLTDVLENTLHDLRTLLDKQENEAANIAQKIQTVTEKINALREEGKSLVEQSKRIDSEKDQILNIMNMIEPQIAG
jgi:hypothetical protein